MVNLDNIKLGSKVQVRSGFGGGPIHTGIVTEVSDDIKNGTPGIGYDVVGLDGQATDDSRWAYLDQVIRLV